MRIFGTGRLPQKSSTPQARFEQAVWPHVDAGFNLARYLTRNEHDAEDVLQEAMVRAFASFDSFRGGDCRSWILTIVRNTGYTFLRQRSDKQSIIFEEELHDIGDDSADPEVILLESLDGETLRRAIDVLPVEFREILVLRDSEELSYREIATITGLPIGTVMSRLSRARRKLQAVLIESRGKENEIGV